MRTCAVSIDVDPIPCYYRIHGLGAAPAELRDIVLRRAVPRFAELFARRGMRATFFLVGQDVDADALGNKAHAARALVSELARAGHEIGNHSYSHLYELARLGPTVVANEIRRAHELLGDAAGKPVIGFRAPGYDVSATMLEELSRLGYVYDSSIFPAPGYYAAKAVIMGILAAAGRPSGAVLTNPRALAASTEPYRPATHAPWRRGQAALIELPVAVTRHTRLPVIGTSLLLAPEWLRIRCLEAMRSRRFFNFELHGIDLCDADLDGIPGELTARQPDLRVPLERKLRVLEAILDRISLDFAFAPLGQVASELQRSL